MKKIFSNKLFMATFVSDLISNFGDIVYYLALMNYVLILPNGKTAIALVTISETFPFLTNIVMGILGDRTKNKVDTILGLYFSEYYYMALLVWLWDLSLHCGFLLLLLSLMFFQT